MLTFVEKTQDEALTKHIIPLIDGKPIIIDGKKQDGNFDKQSDINLYKEFRKEYYEGYNPNNIRKLRVIKNGEGNKTWKLNER